MDVLQKKGEELPEEVDPTMKEVLLPGIRSAHLGMVREIRVSGAGHYTNLFQIFLKIRIFEVRMTLLIQVLIHR